MFENENRLRLFVQQKLIQTSLDGSESFFDALAQHLGEALGVDYVVIDRLDKTPGVAETVALFAKGAIVPNLRYDLKGTPCENVMGRKFCFYPQGIQHQFPDDALLVEMGAESYAGIPLWDSAGESIGLIAVLNSKPFSDEGSISGCCNWWRSGRLRNWSASAATASCVNASKNSVPWR